MWGYELEYKTDLTGKILSRKRFYGKRNPMDPALSVLDICFDYRKKEVLRSVSFSVARGAICGLLGPNASGKTTLLKCINGVLQPRGGEVKANGQTIGHLSRQEIARIMAVVPQQTSLVFAFTALQMVIMGRAARLDTLRLPSRQDRADAERALVALGIGSLSGRFFNELSGGERQLVLLARALFQDTPILLLDEPTSHLDFRNQFMIMDVVRDMTRKNGLATVVSLHDPNLAARYCTQLVVLKDGALYREGPTEIVFERRTLEEVYGMEVVIERTAGRPATVMPRAADGRA